MRRSILLGALVAAIGLLGCGGVEDHTKPGRFCEIHNIPYAEEVIPIHYFGKPETPKVTRAQQKWMKEEYTAREKDYPNSHLNDGIGGCMVRDAKFAKVNYCPECRKAEEQWRASHAPYPKDDQGPKVKFNDY